MCCLCFPAPPLGGASCATHPGAGWPPNWEWSKSLPPLTHLSFTISQTFSLSLSLSLDCLAIYYYYYYCLPHVRLSRISHISFFVFLFVRRFSFCFFSIHDFFCYMPECALRRRMLYFSISPVSAVSLSHLHTHDGVLSHFMSLVFGFVRFFTVGLALGMANSRFYCCFDVLLTWCFLQPNT